MEKENWNRVIRFFIVLIAAIASLLLIYFLSGFTYPFIIALIFAVAINPMAGFLENSLKLPRGMAVIATLFILIGLFAGFVTLLIGEVMAGAAYLAAVVPEHAAVLIRYLEEIFASRLIPLYERLAGMFKSMDSGQQDAIMNSISDTGNKITGNVTEFLQNFFLKLPGLISWIPGAATVIVFSFLATFFISKDWYKLRDRFLEVSPPHVKKSVAHIYTDLKKALAGFIHAQLTLISITLVIVLAGLLILQVDYAITVALIIGFLDLLPYLGTGAVFVPWMLYEILAGDTRMALGLAILYTVVVAQRQVMEPKLLSASIGIHPLATLVALFAGYKAAGFIGLILGPVTLVLLTTLHKANVFHDIWSYIKGSRTIPPK